MGASVSVKDMRIIPDIVERKAFFEMTGYNEYALKATKNHSQNSMTMAALTGQQIVYASKINSQYVIITLIKLIIISHITFTLIS